MKLNMMKYNPVLVKINYSYIIRVVIVLYSALKHKIIINDLKILKTYFILVIWMKNMNYLVMKTKKLLVNSKLKNLKTFI